MTVFASVQAHFLVNNADITGVAPNGVDSGETLATSKLRGRYRKWTACTNGGLFGFEHAATEHSSPSGMLRQVLWNLPGVTAVTFAWLDMDNVEQIFDINAGAVGMLDMQQELLVLPRGHLKISGTGKLNAAGGIVTIWEGGWLDDMMAHVKSVGSMNLP